MTAPTEPTDQGEQFLIDGVEPRTEAQRLECNAEAWAARRRAKARPFDESPLGDVTGRKQVNLF